MVLAHRKLQPEELGALRGVVSGHEEKGVPLKRCGQENRKVCQSRPGAHPTPDPGPDTSWVTLRQCHCCSVPRLSHLRIGVVMVSHSRGFLILEKHPALLLPSQGLVLAAGRRSARGTTALPRLLPTSP